jgi:hypothetical protein
LDSKRPKQVGNQQSIVKYVSTDAGPSSGTNAIVPVTITEARKEQQQDEDAIMVIEEAPSLSPSKVTHATSEEVLNDPPSDKQQESPSSIPTSAQALKKLPAAKLNSTNCIFEWNTEGPVIKAQSQVKMPLSSQHKLSHATKKIQRVSSMR